MMEQMDWEYYTGKPGIGGELKEQVDDFVVQELSNHELDEDGDHLIVQLRKQNMTTMDAVNTLSNMLHISKDRIGYAGNKDKRAITEQYISIQGVSEEDVRQIFTDEFELEVVGKNGYIGLGNLEANRFEITIRDLNLPQDDIKRRTESIVEDLDGKFPNYFGRQRFGSSRPITHQVGRLILKGEFEEAVWTYIAKPYDQEYSSIRKVREELWDTRQVEDAAEKFPKQYRYEKALLYHLTKNPEDYKGAIKRLPEGLQQLFIHAYQSWVFNRALSKLLEDDWYDEKYEIPLVGYKTDLKDNKPENIIKEVLEQEGVSQEDFRLQEMPELRSEGSYRRAFGDFRKFSVLETDEDDLNMSKNKERVKFDLPKGSYATVMLREIMKNN
ncbi:tRNA pseudouridine(13) synthase TruD [Candidatus Nanohalococcus occultus]|uniref:Probable tRNA pseudouridine synthase D n=1 Tax=Candidatus Nanohalococcus occultus TaxID=2978047 RepID=A0ABY8CGV6_9ARCH|nr:tRNA(Glu) U13 pseudouridine synthase TruD [Candidatus Nanohaloarchaeota archaeon SVXNc]